MRQNEPGGRWRARQQTPILALMLLAVTACVPLPSPGPTASGSTASRPPASSADPPLVAQFTSAPPQIDGEVDDAWSAALPFALPLTWGARSRELAYRAELRALYTTDALYLLARWPDASAPAGDGEPVIANKLTMHWALPPPSAESAAPACDVACHTAYTDQSGRIVDMQAETVPPGADEALAVAGVWRDGVWTVEWARPLRSANHNDLQFADLSAAYPFFLKIFERREGQADPVSATRLLAFDEQ